MNDMGIMARKPRKQFQLTENHKKDLLAYARKYVFIDDKPIGEIYQGIPQQQMLPSANRLYAKGLSLKRTTVERREGVRSSRTGSEIIMSPIHKAQKESSRNSKIRIESFWLILLKYSLLSKNFPIKQLIKKKSSYFKILILIWRDKKKFFSKKVKITNALSIVLYAAYIIVFSLYLH